MAEVNKFVYKEARTLPVFLLLDTSGSMNQEGRISVLNIAVRDMLKSFKDLDSTNAQIAVSIITFGNEVKVQNELTPIFRMEEFENLTAYGMTPLGGALEKAKEMIENKDIVTSRTYRPVVVLVSDGMPNDEWEKPLADFIEEGRTSKCYRMAMGIGADEGTAQYEMLQKFIAKEEKVFCASQALDIVNFFKYVTMSVTTKSANKNPNKAVDIRIEDVYDDEESLF